MQKKKKVKIHELNYKYRLDTVSKILVEKFVVGESMRQ